MYRYIHAKPFGNRKANVTHNNSNCFCAAKVVIRHYSRSDFALSSSKIEIVFGSSVDSIVHILFLLWFWFDSVRSKIEFIDFVNVEVQLQQRLISWINNRKMVSWGKAWNWQKLCNVNRFTIATHSMPCIAVWPWRSMTNLVFSLLFPVPLSRSTPNFAANSWRFTDIEYQLLIFLSFYSIPESTTATATNSTKLHDESYGNATATTSSTQCPTAFLSGKTNENHKPLGKTNSNHNFSQYFSYRVRWVLRFHKCSQCSMVPHRIHMHHRLRFNSNHNLWLARHRHIRISLRPNIPLDIVHRRHINRPFFKRLPHKWHQTVTKYRCQPVHHK